MDIKYSINSTRYISLILLDILFSFEPRIGQIPPYDKALTPSPAKGEVRRGLDIRSQAATFLRLFPLKNTDDGWNQARLSALFRSMVTEYYRQTN
jgi:hypothetical protein